jgi:VIT1/CCC1 family predicted Fe2+/Mn2+ transporter
MFVLVPVVSFAILTLFRYARHISQSSSFWSFRLAPGVRGFWVMERYLSIFLATGIVVTLGGFFLYVPILPGLTVAALLSGLLAMFWLGIHVGRRPVPQTSKN